MSDERKRSPSDPAIRIRLFQGGILVVFLIALYFALAGVDYGPQWDQNLIKGNVNKFIRTGDLLPGEYVYPPMSSYIATSTVIPYSVPFVLRYGTNWTPTQQYLLDEVLKNPNESFLLNLRRVFVTFTMLAILWTGLAAGQRDWLAGLVAAGALAFSWEISYHSRLIHPDGPTMQFSALAILFGLLAFFHKKPFSDLVWLCLAAAAAAFATATKYTAGISLFVVLILAYAVLKEKGERTRRILFVLAGLVILFAVVFAVLVPGVFLETQTFIQHVAYGQNVYASGHGRQTVDAGWDYFVRVIVYIFQAAFSNNRILALVVPLLSALGIVSLLLSRQRRDLYLAAALIGVPLVYILFLITHRVLFVRNLLQILPSLAILAGFGFSWLLQRLGKHPLVVRAIPAGILLLVVSVNLSWISYSTWTIQMRRTSLFAEQALQEIGRQTEVVYVTPAAHDLLGDRPLPDNARLEFNADTDLVLFAYLGDTIDEEEGGWPVNFPGASPQIFGPQEINMDWHASWPGVERLVLSVPELAWQDGAILIENPEVDPSMAEQGARGELSLDGEQFFLTDQTGRRINILNSANPSVILALKPLVDSDVEITGRPHSRQRANDWFLISLGGKQVLGEADLELQFNSIRLLAGLDEDQAACIAQVAGPARSQALGDNMLPFIDFSTEELLRMGKCLDGG